MAIVERLRVFIIYCREIRLISKVAKHDLSLFFLMMLYNELQCTITGVQ